MIKALMGLAVLAVMSCGCPPSIASAEPGNQGCGSESRTILTGHIGEGSVGVSGTCAVRSTDLPGAGGLPVLVIDCGYATATDDHTFWNKACGPTGFPCPAIAGNPAPHQFLTTAALTDPPVPIAQWCAGVDTPMPSAAALRDEIIRLLRPSAIGVSPNTGTGLVNLKTLFWIHTASTVNLGRAALIGFPVELKVIYDRTEFDFGDGSSGILAPTPGSPYDPAHDCGACAAEFGHTYTRPGPVTITALQPATTTLTVAQARSVLVGR